MKTIGIRGVAPIGIRGVSDIDVYGTVLKKNNEFVPLINTSMSINKIDNNVITKKINFSNAFIPFIDIISNGTSYEIIEDKTQVWLLDSNLNNITPHVKKAKINPKKQKVILKFIAKKGNKKADDSDGGIITVHFYDELGKHIDYKKIKINRYGDTFNVIIEKNKNISQLSFYADDNDRYFDGGISHVLCGAVKISFDCLDELLKENVESIVNLKPEERAMFMATVLMESANGKQDLWDIAYIYLNLVGKYGLDSGLTRSSAYGYKQFGYKAHLFNLGFGKEYSGEICKEENKMKGRTVEGQAKIFSTFDQITKFKEFCNVEIFVDSPKSYYKGWEGQGYYGDMNIRMHDDRRIWAMASQYFHLQNQGIVNKKLVAKLLDTKAVINNMETGKEKMRDSTTFLYDSKNIIQYFDINKNKLPNFKKGDYLPKGTTAWKIAVNSPNNEIPPVYLLEEQQK